MKKTKVLFLCWGYSIHARRRIQIFCDDDRFEVTVVSPHGYNFSPATNIKLIGDANVRELRGVWNFLRLIKLTVLDYFTLRAAYRKVKPDVIFLQTLMYPCYLAYFLPRRTPTIITFWNGDVIWWAKWNGIERMLKKQIVTAGVRRARAITVNSQMAFDKCLEYGVPKEKINLIRYPGVELSRFKPQSKGQARKELSIKHDHVIFWPRGLGEYLNEQTLFKSAPQILARYPGTLFVIAAKVGANLVPKYQSALKKQRLDANFKFVANIEHNLMPVYYAASDAMVSLSGNDSLPNVMLEAFACETPVIMSDIEQIKEWVKNRYNGFLVPPDDPQKLAKAVNKILEPNNQKEMQTIVRRSRELVEKQADSVKNITAVKNLVLGVGNE